MHVRDNGMGEEEVVIVKTDIDAPTATPFEEVKNPEGVLTQVLNANPETADEEVTSSLSRSVLMPPRLPMKTAAR